MLELELKNSHLSIKRLLAPELPKLTVLTGVNGSGKSHLMSGLTSGKISAKVFGNDVKQDEIRLISASDFLNKSETQRGKSDDSQVDRFWKVFQTTLNHYCINPDQKFLLDNYKLKKKEYYKKFDIEIKREDSFIQATKEDSGAVRRIEKNIKELPVPRYETIHELINSCSKNILHAIDVGEKLSRNSDTRVLGKNDISHVIAKIISENNDPIRNVYKTLSLIQKTLNIDIALLTEKSFREHIPNEYQLNPFDRSFTNWFVEYRDAIRINRNKKDDHEDNSSVSFLNENQFQEKYGKKPWQKMDSILKVLGIDLSFIPPLSSNLDGYVAKLKNNIGDIIDTKNISSREKVILSLISSIKYSSSFDFPFLFPKLILLDEPDAHLHPKFANILMDMLQELTSQRNDLCCIIVTHSPTTVALAAEDAIFHLANKPNEKVISPIEKETMLSVLTHGLPSLNISTKNARQIYVEGKEDQEIYHIIHDRYLEYCVETDTVRPKAHLGFIYHGINNDIEGKGGASGCSSVITQVQSIREIGGNTVYGVLDWDCGANKESDGIFVFGYERGFSIENFILHSFIILMYLSSINREINLSFLNSEKIKTSLDIKESSIYNLEEGEAQNICNNFCKYILNDVDILDYYETKLVGFDYKIKIPKKYRNYRGYDLSDAILRKIPMLNDEKQFSQELKKKAMKIERKKH